MGESDSNSESTDVGQGTVTELERLPKLRDNITKRVGVLLLLGFILPIPVGSYGGLQFRFPNLEYTRATPVELLLLFSPLVAGIATLFTAYLKAPNRMKSRRLLALGIIAALFLFLVGLVTAIRARAYVGILFMVPFIPLAGLLGSARSLVHRPLNARGHLITKVCVVIALLTNAAFAFMMFNSGGSTIDRLPVIRDLMPEQIATNIAIGISGVCQLAGMIVCLCNGPGKKNPGKAAKLAFQLLIAAIYVPFLWGVVLAARKNPGVTSIAAMILSLIKMVGWFGCMAFLLPFGISEMLISSGRDEITGDTATPHSGESVVPD